MSVSCRQLIDFARSCPVDRLPALIEALRRGPHARSSLGYKRFEANFGGSTSTTFEALVSVFGVKDDLDEASSLPEIDVFSLLTLLILFASEKSEDHIDWSRRTDFLFDLFSISTPGVSLALPSELLFLARAAERVVGGLCEVNSESLLPSDWQRALHASRKLSKRDSLSREHFSGIFCNNKMAISLRSFVDQNRSLLDLMVPRAEQVRLRNSLYRVEELKEELRALEAQLGGVGEGQLVLDLLAETKQKLANVGLLAQVESSSSGQKVDGDFLEALLDEATSEVKVIGALLNLGVVTSTTSERIKKISGVDEENIKIRKRVMLKPEKVEQIREVD